MKLRKLVVLAGALLSVAAPTVPSAVEAAGPTFPYEVGVDPGVEPAEHAVHTLKKIGIAEDEQQGRLEHVYQHLLKGYAVELTPTEALRADRVLEDDPDVLSFGRSWEVSTGPFGFSGVSLADEQVEPLALQRHGMPIVDRAALGEQPIVAVLDTGVDANHPDLNVLPGFNAVNPGEEIVDVIGHGTFLSGVIGALDNGFGIRGGAPGAGIVPVKVLGDDGIGWTADIVAGLDYIGGLVLSGQRVDVINMSFGGPNDQSECGGFDLAHNAICALEALDVVTVTSAGNSNSNARNFSPANYPETLAVGAIADYDGQPGGLAPRPDLSCAAGSADDARATFANFGDVVRITAVGVCNLGTLPTNWDHPELLPHFQGYGSGSGTSFSGPLVAAAIARYRAANPDQPGRVAVDQVLRHSAMYGGTFTNDPDGIAEPVLWLGEIPRWEG